MTEESTPQPIQHPSISGHLPNIEILADSEDPELIEARAKLLEAQAKLAKASTPLLDKVIIRGLLPIAIALVGHWAAQTYENAQIEQVKQGETITALEGLLEKQQETAKTMAATVVRLDETLKFSLIQMAVAQALAKVEPMEPTKPSPLLVSVPTPEDVTQGVTEQISLPGVEESEIRRIATDSYYKILKTKGR